MEEMKAKGLTEPQIAKALTDYANAGVTDKKDMITVSGFKVYPNEIEDVAARHPGIFESAAIGAKSTDQRISSQECSPPSRSRTSRVSSR